MGIEGNRGHLVSFFRQTLHSLEGKIAREKLFENINFLFHVRVVTLVRAFRAFAVQQKREI